MPSIESNRLKLPYGEARSLVSNETFWSLQESQIIEKMDSELPHIYAKTRRWIAMRPTMTIERKPSDARLWNMPNYIQRERGYFASASREAREFVVAALY